MIELVALDGPLFCHTPKQKLLVAGGREEFKISVPSLCHCAKPLSITVPSGMPELPSDINFTFQNPTIGDARLKRDESGMWHGTIQSVDLRVEGAGVPSTETLQKEGSGSQTFYAPRGEGDHFLVIAWSGHEDHECNGRWTISGSHPLAKAVTIGSSIYGCCFRLQGGGYRMDAAK